MTQKASQDIDANENEIECPICGKRVYYEVLVCPKCGLHFYPEEQPEPVERVKPVAAPALFENNKMPYPVYRRWFGVQMVTASALAYGLVSQLINRLLMPGVSLYQPPFGPIGNILLALLIGASLGFLIATAESGAVGVLWGSMLGALFMGIAALLTSTNPVIWQKLTAVVIIFVPTAAALVPLLVLFRWAIGREEEAYRNASKGYAYSRVRRFFLPAILVVGAGALGLFSMYGDLARAVTPRMEALIQQGRQAASAEMLPAPLNSPNVKYFFQQKSSGYTLQWDKDDQNKYGISRPAGGGYLNSTVIARFDTGYLLVCMFPNQTGEPSCKDFPPQ